MKNARIAFEEFDGGISEIPPGYQKVDCHFIFDIKMGESFHHKAWMIAGDTRQSLQPSSHMPQLYREIGFSSLFIIVALNGIRILACDIQITYLAA